MASRTRLGAHFVAQVFVMLMRLGHEATCRRPVTWDRELDIDATSNMRAAGSAHGQDLSVRADTLNQGHKAEAQEEDEEQDEGKEKL